MDSSASEADASPSECVRMGLDKGLYTQAAYMQRHTIYACPCLR